MENAVAAEKDGVVKEIQVSAGDSVGCRRRRGGHRVDDHDRRSPRRPRRPRPRSSTGTSTSSCSLSHFVHAHPELCFDETTSARAVAEALRAGGLDGRRGRLRPADGARVPRRRRATSSSPSAPSTTRCPTSGHACGHNIIAATAVGAGLALAAVADELGLTVRVLGTPAEEGGGGKVLMLERGAFAGVHAAMMVHPWPTERLTGPLPRRRPLRRPLHRA